MSDSFTKLTYQTLQQSKNLFALAHKNVSSSLWGLIYPNQSQVKPAPPETLLKMQQKYNELMETDWQDAEEGIYSVDVLFDNPWGDFLRYYPMVCLDLPSIWERARQKKYQDFAPEISTEGYPSYYTQNFHHQTDGYLSDLSANLYDLQVEILFGGAADAMRRRILAPLRKMVNKWQILGESCRQVRILDVACGTGRTLKLIRQSLSQPSLYGVDLSPAYLRKANELLSQIPGELPQLLQANGEELPFLDDYFHAVTCVFLFHELPPSARQRVIEQAFRVTKPGGTFIICDSIQMDDSPEFEPLMENFQKVYHEPYYRHYSTDNLVKRLENAGFQQIEIQVHFASKYLVAQKPSE
ncbi:class I SAM-dependent methyltransferase [Calothrix sp. 336/3]|uniref:class I SAM-dependent methyltransferase n=1 Tax=Calothrix sp. 336/3 TaxID=1337936 RepID=UPI0004E31789|nr:class I SAM-dependent methyltransferase [Calothrix sp. 336/3]AKG24227.1 methyltransferase [Calothrix sp. 336/3]